MSATSIKEEIARSQGLGDVLTPRDVRYLRTLGALAEKYVQLEARIAVLEEGKLRRLKRRLTLTLMKWRKTWPIRRSP